MGYLQLWDLDMCTCLWTISHSPQQKVVCLQISPDSTFIISGTDQGQIYLWSMGNGSMLKQYSVHGYLFLFFVFICKSIMIEINRDTEAQFVQSNYLTISVKWRHLTLWTQYIFGRYRRAKILLFQRRIHSYLKERDSFFF